MLTRKSFLVGTLAMSIAGPLVGCGRTGVRVTRTSNDDDVKKKDVPMDISDTSIVIGTVSDPYAVILDEFVTSIFKENKASATVQRFNSVKQCNKAVADGTVNAAFCLNANELDAANQDSGTELENAGPVFYCPYGLFSKKFDSVSSIPDEATIAVPNDPAKEERAIQLLYQEGLLASSDSPEEGEPTDEDAPEDFGEGLADNPVQLKIERVEEKDLIGALDTADCAIFCASELEGSAKGDIPRSSDALVLEASDSPTAHDNAAIVTVAPGKAEDPKVLALMQVLKSEDFDVYMQDVYGQELVPTS